MVFYAHGLAGQIPDSSTSPVIGNELTAVVARDAAGESADSFSTETSKIYLRWKTDFFNNGRMLRCIWIAEDVGDAAPKDYHVDEASFILDQSHPSGLFTLSKPKNGWPAGKYRAELYVGDKLVETVSFTIEQQRGD